MKKQHYSITILTSLLVLTLTIFNLTSCVHEDDTYKNTRNGNFEALWQIMDEHYCFFSYKEKELGVNWNEVHDRYAKQVNEKMSNAQLFEVLCNMLSELEDGHVNLSASFDYGRNWSFYEDYPLNYNDSIASLYLGHDYSIASGIKYCILDDNIGYIRCETFEDGIGDGNVSVMLQNLSTCSGLIIDVRSNGGGQLTKAHTLASHFLNEKTIIGYVSHKTGKGHNDFSTPEAEWLDPSNDGVRWQKPAVVLTNRGCYSACNDFVKCMKLCPNVTIMGDKTGGGSGMPFNSELPNGWQVRYSAVVYYDKDMKQTEFGIEPDIYIEMDGKDTDQNYDTLIEHARKKLTK